MPTGRVMWIVSSPFLPPEIGGNMRKVIRSKEDKNQDRREEEDTLRDVLSVSSRKRKDEGDTTRQHKQET
jgi:hypothetical protein